MARKLGGLIPVSGHDRVTANLLDTENPVHEQAPIELEEM